jgi:hypothetical protein
MPVRSLVPIGLNAQRDPVKGDLYQIVSAIELNNCRVDRLKESAGLRSGAVRFVYLRRNQ